MPARATIVRAGALASAVVFALAFAFVLGGCDRSAAPSEDTSSWDGESVDTSWFEEGASSYQLTSADQFAGFSQLVDEGHDFANATVELMCNVDLGGHEWNPIGEGLEEGDLRFCGTFDGRNNGITGLHVLSPLGYQALFANVCDGTLKNFFVQGSVQGRENSAGVAANAVNENFENIVSDIDVFSTNYFKNVSTGGICGLYFADEPDATFRFTDCINNGYIEANNWQVAGLIGSAGLTDGTTLVMERCENRGCVHVDMISRENDECIGGIVSQLGTYGTYELIDCSNTADVEATDLRNIGGIVGVVQGDATTIRHCSNTGRIETGTLNDLSVAGGIVGSVKAQSCTIEECTNEGDVKTYNGKSFSIAQGFE